MISIYIWYRNSDADGPVIKNIMQTSGSILAIYVRLTYIEGKSQFEGWEVRPINVHDFHSHKRRSPDGMGL